MLSKEVTDLIRRLQRARLSLMRKHPFYALLLLHMKFSIDEYCETAYTDGERIAFRSEFIAELTDAELEYVLMHEVLHVALNHVGRRLENYDYDMYNIACDIVVNSNILYSSDMDLSSISIGEYQTMHQLPNGEEGYFYDIDEVYEAVRMLNMQFESDDSNTDDFNIGVSSDSDADADNSDLQNTGDNSKLGGRPDGGWDDHSFWNGESEEDSDSSDVSTEDIWLQRMIEATDVAARVNNQGSKDCGKVPFGVERLIKELTECKTDWRTILDNFVQEEINDYSFCPPDRRFQDSCFLLPDFNEKDDTVKDILFMIDTSGSMSDDEITQAYSEIKGAIDQFNGRLKGWLGFFDATIVEPIPFEDEDELMIIRPKGGGGTSFHCIFKYLKKHVGDDFAPSSIVILTDGYADFPEEKVAMGIPVLWMINNNNVTPPWGKLARIN